MSDKKQGRLIIPNEEFKTLCAKHDFSQAEAGCRTMLCMYLEELAERAVKTSVLEADQHKKVTLKEEHGREAIKKTPGIPKGNY